MKGTKELLGWLLLLATVVALQTKLSHAKRPNILFILADDLGYGEVGAFSVDSPHGRIATPNLDRLRSEGMMFTNAYVGQAVCAPSRCTLMTGLHSGHAYVRGNRKLNHQDIPLPRNHTTVADVLKSAGYRTAAIGKWALGHNDTEGAPRKHGFDYYYGQIDQTQAHNYYPPYVWENEWTVELPRNLDNRPTRTLCMSRPEECSHTHDLFTDKAFEWLRNQSTSEDPFFLYLAYTVPHAGGWTTDNEESGSPVSYLADYVDPTWPTVEQDHASMITNYLDRDVGRLMALLDELGLGNDTIVFFASDNGASNEGGHNYMFFRSSGPLRGYKRYLYEGGIRSPSLVRWRGKVPENSTSDFYWAFWDFLPTAADIAGVPVSELPSPIDGVSILPTLLGQSQEEKPYLYWEFCRSGHWGYAVRAGRWKAVSPSVGARLELYDIVNDIGETNDVAREYPDIVQNMEAIARDSHVDSHLFPIDRCYG
eukprot:TRINITY_DN3588_c0_g1_i2.p1 TRINITY_DN3588_c0_g1~~TRINITY_DN3588_c0_g1_i2.p1  ORF type:complete len:481 (-),score=66.13 TRINITY_DN3588_c0_g1_i2:81-1523(-)